MSLFRSKYDISGKRHNPKFHVIFCAKMLAIKSKLGARTDFIYIESEKLSFANYLEEGKYKI